MKTIRIRLRTLKYVRLIAALLFIGSTAIDIQAQIRNPKGIAYQWRTDTTKRIVDLNEFTLAVPRKTYPIIDYPTFIDREEGESHYFRHEPVIAIESGDQARAYPLSLLTMHELTNDTFGGIPILPTFCPLCNSSIVYDRRVKVGGQLRVLEFEVSGLLRHHDMVMFDRQTETWWQQLTGEAEVGFYSGQMLDMMPSLVISVEEFFQSHPNGKIMDYHTQVEAEKRYGSNPTFHYDSLGNGPFIDVPIDETFSERLPAMERVIDVHGDAHDKIYPFSEIAKTGVVNDSFDEQRVVIFYHNETIDPNSGLEAEKAKKIGTATVFDSHMDDQVLHFEKAANGLFRDIQTGSLWDITGHCVEGSFKGRRLWFKAHSNDFAFAYLAFHPDAIIYRAP